jgi:hypothetical protein
MGAYQGRLDEREDTTPDLVRLERILTMVYVEQNSQNFSGLFPSSGD